MLEAQNEWYDLGLVLGLKPSRLDGVKNDQNKVQTCLREMLKICLNDNTSLTWSGLCEALRKPTVGHNVLAESIEEKIRTKQKSDVAEESTKQKRSHDYSDGGSVASDDEEVFKSGTIIATCIQL